MENNESLKNKILDLLNTENVMYLATTVDSTPSVSSVFYGLNEETMEVYFFTFTPTVKGTHLRFNDKVQAHISKKADGREIKGVQITGYCEKVKDKELIEQKIKPLINKASNNAFADYYGLQVAGWYKIKPTMIKYIDFYSNPQFEFMEFKKNQKSFLGNMKYALFSRFKVWAQASRAPFFTASIIPILLGAVIAWGLTGKIDLPILGITLVAGVFIHAGTNMLNDYFDHTSGNDEVNKYATPFNGGSRIIQTGTMSSLKIGMAAIICFILGSIGAIYLESLVGDQLILSLLIVGCFLGIFYTADPLRLGYKTLGEFIVAIGFGPIYVLVSFHIQTAIAGAPSLSLMMPLYWSMPIGLLIANVLLMNEFQDYDADKAVHKNTLVVKLGKQKALKLYKSANFLSYLWIFAGAIMFFNNAILTLIALVTIPLARKAIKNAEENVEKIYELIPSNVYTIGLHLFTGLLIVVGIFLTNILIV